MIGEVFFNLRASLLLFCCLSLSQAWALEVPGDPRGTEVGQSLVKWEWDRVPGAEKYEITVDGSHVDLTADPQYFSFNMWAGEHSLTVRSVRNGVYSESTPTIKIIVRDWFSPTVHNKSFVVGVDDQSLTQSTLAPPPSRPAAPTGLRASTIDSSTIKWEWDAVQGASNYDLHVDGGYSTTTQNNYFVSYKLEPGIHSAKVLAVLDDGSITQFSEDIKYDSTAVDDPVVGNFVEPIVSSQTIVSAADSGFSNVVAEDYLRDSSIQGTLPPLNYLETVNESVSNLTLKRVSSNQAFGVVNGRARHEYSKRQPWNADESLLDIGGRVIDAYSHQIVRDYIPLSTERGWSNVNPKIIFGLYSNAYRNSLSSFNVESGQLTELMVFGGYEQCTMGDGEGNVTDDDNYVVIVCNALNSAQKTIFSVDLSRGLVIGKMLAQSNVNWAGFSPSGNYIVVENGIYPDPSPSLIVYDKSLGFQRYLGTPSHGDFGYDDQGNEVYAMIRYRKISYTRLSDGAFFELGVSDENSPIGHGHLSCRNSLRPGWCYFSSLEGPWMGAVLLSQEARKIEHWGYHRSNTYFYQSSPKAVPSRSGDQLLFTSNWNGFGEINDYILFADDR